MITITPEINDYLLKLYRRTKKYQSSKKDIIFELSYFEFIDLWQETPGRFKTLVTHIEKGDADRFMASDSRYVCTWQSREFLLKKLFNKNTACILKWDQSKIRLSLKKGDTHTEETKQVMSLKKIGHKVGVKQRQKTSQALKGIPKTQAQKEAMALGKLRAKERRMNEKV